MQRERERERDVSASTPFDQTDDGVDAETSLSLSLSLHFYLSSPPLHFFLTLTFGLYILFEDHFFVLLCKVPCRQSQFHPEGKFTIDFWFLFCRRPSGSIPGQAFVSSVVRNEATFDAFLSCLGKTNLTMWSSICSPRPVVLGC